MSKVKWSNKFQEYLYETYSKRHLKLKLKVKRSRPKGFQNETNSLKHLKRIKIIRVGVYQADGECLDGKLASRNVERFTNLQLSHGATEVVLAPRQTSLRAAVL